MVHPPVLKGGRLVRLVLNAVVVIVGVVAETGYQEGLREIVVGEHTIPTRRVAENVHRPDINIGRQAGERVIVKIGIVNQGHGIGMRRVRIGLGLSDTFIKKGEHLGAGQGSQVRRVVVFCS